MKKKALFLTLALVMCLGLTIPASAEVEGLWIYYDSDSGYGTCITLDHRVDGTEVQGYVENNVEAMTKYTVAEGDMIGVNSPIYANGTLHLYGMELNEAGIYQRNGKEKVLDYGDYVLGSDFAGCWTPYSRVILEVLPAAQPQQPATPPAVTVENIPASGTAKASTQSVEVDGKKIEFQMYALLDTNGNSTNYVKLRDLAHVLNGTAAQFSVGYDGTISLTTGQPYQDTGSEMTTPFSGDRAYTGGGQSVKINGSAVEMTAINLLDDNGGGYNYFKLRDLGMALGFNVSWSAERGIFVETGKPYAG